MIKAEDIEITDMVDDPVFLGVYIDCRCWQEKCDGYKECADCRNNQKTLKQQILENQKRSDWLAIIEDLVGNKITDNESLGKLFQLIKKGEKK